jgi:hypothetical protein
METTRNSFQPTWWSEQHASTWERVKAAMRRDFEQTKNDFGGGPDLDQDVHDTLKQAAGVEPIPAPGTKTPPSAAELDEQQKDKRDQQSVDEGHAAFGNGEPQRSSTRPAPVSTSISSSITSPSGPPQPSFAEIESPLSFGYAASAQYKTRYPMWTPELEAKLRTEWMAAPKARQWDDVSAYVRRGFESRRTG